MPYELFLSCSKRNYEGKRMCGMDAIHPPHPGACKGPDTGSPDKKSKRHVVVLGDFEKKTDLNKWKGSDSFSKEFPAHGKACCKLTSPDGQALWIETGDLPKDWESI